MELQTIQKNIQQIYKGSNILTISEIVKSESPCIALLRKANEDLLNTNIDAMFIKVCSLFKLNDSKSLSNAEIIEATQILKEEYYYLKWDDLILFVRKIKKGEYNDIYNRFDMPTFFAMLNRYVLERKEVFASSNRVEATTTTKEPMSEKTKEMLNEFFANQRKKQVKESTPQIDGNDIVKDWIEDFKKQVGNLTGFIDFEGKKLNVNEYLESRLKDYQKDN